MVDRRVEWVLRIGVFGIFFGHGVWALSVKEGWFSYFTALGIAEAAVPTLLLLIGAADVLAAFVMLLRPYKIVLLGAVCWAFVTAAIRPVTALDPLFSGLFSIELMDLVERFGNFMLPLALLLYKGWPKTWKEWFTV